MKGVKIKLIRKDDKGRVIEEKTVLTNTDTKEQTYTQIHTEYNKKDQKIKVTKIKNGKLSRAMRYNYDDNGNLSEKFTETKHHHIHKKYEYDESGNMIETNAISGTITKYLYDDHKNIIQIIHSNGSISILNRDDNGNLLSHVIDGKEIDRYEYDDKGRVIKITSPDVTGDMKFSYFPGICIIKDCRDGDDVTTYEICLNIFPESDIIL